jgi:hypothetical protein
MILDIDASETQDREGGKRHQSQRGKLTRDAATPARLFDGRYQFDRRGFRLARDKA